MSPKLVYQRQYWPSPCSGDICTYASLVKSFWANVHPDKLICMLVLNLKKSITKLTRVSFGTSKDYMLQKCVSLSNNQTLKTPTPNDRITCHLCAYSKLASPVILHFTRIKPLKSYKKCFLFHLNCSCGS